MHLEHRISNVPWTKGGLIFLAEGSTLKLKSTVGEILCFRLFRTKSLSSLLGWYWFGQKNLQNYCQFHQAQRQSGINDHPFCQISGLKLIAIWCMYVNAPYVDMWVAVIKLVWFHKVKNPTWFELLFHVLKDARHKKAEDEKGVSIGTGFFACGNLAPPKRPRDGQNQDFPGQLFSIFLSTNYH